MVQGCKTDKDLLKKNTTNISSNRASHSNLEINEKLAKSKFQ